MLVRTPTSLATSSAPTTSLASSEPRRWTRRLGALEGRAVSEVTRRRWRRARSSVEDGRLRSFVCSEALYREFEARAAELDCSLDWLLGEAMQRLLVETRESASLVKPPADVTETSRDTQPDVEDDLATTDAWSAGAEGGDAGPEPIVLCLGDRRVRVERGGFVVGRGDVDLVVDHEDVSRRHFVLEASDDGWMAFDLGSTNGVLLNGSFVVGAIVQPGDVISLGPVLIAVERG